MRFITENELRDLYRQEHFTSFTLQTNERLTPGGRQYLLDHGINMYDAENPAPADTPAATVDGHTAAPAAQSAPAPVAPPEPKVSFDQMFMSETGMSRQELLLRVQSLEKMSLAIAEELRMISSVLGGEKESCQTTETETTDL